MNTTIAPTTIALPHETIARYMTLKRGVLHRDGSPYGGVFVRTDGDVFILSEDRWLRAVVLN